MPMEFRKEGVLMNRSRLATYLVFVFATAIFYVILNALAGGWSGAKHAVTVTPVSAASSVHHRCLHRISACDERCNIHGVQIPSKMRCKPKGRTI